ncbi:hypothetical protein, partial [Pseudomonas cannabina]|uniref:hypothetical protein n=1 Tax=Pseudomonas cannabina TaxID=86840 RepID=UPI001CC300B6
MTGQRSRLAERDPKLAEFVDEDAPVKNFFIVFAVVEGDVVCWVELVELAEHPSVANDSSAQLVDEIFERLFIFAEFHQQSGRSGGYFTFFAVLALNLDAKIVAL